MVPFIWGIKVKVLENKKGIEGKRLVKGSR